MTQSTTDSRSRATPSRRMWRTAAIFTMMSAATLLAILWSRFGTDPGLIDSPLVGRSAPPLTLERLEGPGTVSLDELNGQVVVVNFWASWCLACRTEHPDLVSTATAYADRGVTFLGVVYQDSRANAIEFLDELGRGYENLLDPDSAAAIDFGVFGVPETFFIDSNGAIVGKITGESDALLLSTTLDQILAGETPGSRTVGTVQAERDR